jgi:aldehyde:ferredoxin oxidoreductase
MLRAFNALRPRPRAGHPAQAAVQKPLKGGKSDGVALDRAEFEAALDMYYAMAGWDNRGVPTRATLESAGVGWIADELEAPAA